MQQTSSTPEFEAVIHKNDQFAGIDSMLVVVQVGERKAALMVDSVMCVADYRDDAIEVLPETADNTECILGMVYQEDGTYTLIADLEHIFSTACPAE